MLKEIHTSKMTFCDYELPEHAQQDLIIDGIDIGLDASIEEILNPETIELGKVKRAARIADTNYRAKCTELLNVAEKPKLSQFKFDHNTIDHYDIVFRVMSYNHIPLEPGRKKNPKRVADHHARVNFVPFVHYMIVRNEYTGKDEVKMVLKSHTKDGVFDKTHGAISNNLAKMFLALVNKYSQKGNWRGYTYVDEMRGQALLQLSHMGLQFNEAKSDNPFSYYTSSVKNSFTGVLNSEKKNQDIRDDLLVNAGQSPSFTRQLAIEEEIRIMRESAANNDLNN